MLFGTAAADDDAAGACVRVDGVVPPVFEALLHFVYTDSLPEVVTGRWQYEAAMDLELLVATSRFGMQRLMPICEERLLELLVATSRFGMQRLMPICEERLCRHIKVDTAAGFLLLAHQFGCHRLREACVEFLKCPRALNAAMATDDFERLVKRCPPLLKDMIPMLAAR
jgi:speckle-type POZ protein